MNRASSANSSSSKRPLRLAAEFRRVLPGILRDLNVLPGGLLISITDVEVSDDLSFAKIYFSLLGSDAEDSAEEAARLLNSKKGAVRHAISQAFVMRQHPDFRFVHDPTPARAARIEELFRQIHRASDEPEGTPS